MNKNIIPIFRTTELTKDCFTEYGTIHHTEEFLEEYLKFKQSTKSV